MLPTTNPHLEQPRHRPTRWRSVNKDRPKAQWGLRRRGAAGEVALVIYSHQDPDYRWHCYRRSANGGPTEYVGRFPTKDHAKDFFDFPTTTRVSKANRARPRWRSRRSRRRHAHA